MGIFSILELCEPINDTPSPSICVYPSLIIGRQKTYCPVGLKLSMSSSTCNVEVRINQLSYHANTNMMKDAKRHISISWNLHYHRSCDVVCWRINTFCTDNLFVASVIVYVSL